MIDHIGFAPQPPLLLPTVANGAAAELDELRAACDEMIAEILNRADQLIICTSQEGVELGEWLVQRSEWRGLVNVITMANGLPPADTALRECAGAHDSSAMLVMGDGSACRTEKAPGYLDPRALTFDDDIATWLADVNVDALGTIDQEVAAELLVAGRITWPSAAAVVQADPREWTGELLYRADPYGVSYFVASWQATR